MENAVKALYMAAVILISLMIMTIFVYIFKEGGKVGEKYDLKQNQGQLELFNSKFEYFQKNNNTISDIITVTNLANDVSKEADYNTELSVYIDIKIGNDKYFCITPLKQIERNYIYIGTSSEVDGETNSKKIYSYDFLNTKIADLKSYDSNLNKTNNLLKLDDEYVPIINPDVDTELEISMPDEQIDSNDILSKVDNKMRYKYYFMCTDIQYHSDQNGNKGRVSSMTFELCINEKYNQP